MPKPIYLDYNATTPIDRRVADAMQPYLYEHFGNPSSSHVYGEASKRAVDVARSHVAEMLGCTEEEVLFTSGGTESNNMVLLGAARLAREEGRGNHIVTSTIEHPAVAEPLRLLEREGFRVTWLPVDETGLVDREAARRAIDDQTVLLSVMHANNEVGTIQPIAELASWAREKGAWVHTDAAQSIGKIDVSVQELGVDFLTVVGHKFYAPKGIGALYVRKGIALPNLMFGAGHESGRRPGTENVLLIVGLGEAARWVKQEWKQENERVKRLRDRLWEGLSSRLGERIRLHGHPALHLPNTLNVGFVGLLSQPFLASIREQVAASAGSACHSDHVAISPVLQAMNVPLASAQGAVRFSVGRLTNAAQIDKAIEMVSKAVLRWED